MMLLNVVYLQTLMDQQGLTQLELARRSGISKNGLNNIMKESACRVQHKTLRRLAKTLEVEEETLLAPATAATLSSGALQSPLVEVGRLLAHTRALLFGREQELAQLTAAWQSSEVNLYCLCGRGGLGKTALVHYWLRRGSPDYWGAQRIFAWSFPGQGTAGEAPVTASDRFLSAALEWFGEEGERLGSLSHKALHLAGLLRRVPTLLILDGLEVLQTATSGDGGFLSDEPLHDLLGSLVASNPGLCVVTSRLALSDFSAYNNAGMVEQRLQPLSEGACRELITDFGVRGSEADLQRLIAHQWNDPLCLTLLASFLVALFPKDPDIRHCSLVTLVEADQQATGQAWRILQEYQARLNASHLALLRLVALFQEPVARSLLESLCFEEVLPGLNEPLVKLNEIGWRMLLANLQQSGLLLQGEIQREETLDIHPIFRHFLRDQMKREQLENYRHAQGVIYRRLTAGEYHFSGRTDDLWIAYRAIYHGCEAQQHEQIFRELIWQRMMQGYAATYLHGHGAGGLDRVTVGRFFSGGRVGVATLKPSLQASDQRGYIYWWAGLIWRIQGYIEAAIPLFEAAQQEFVRIQDSLGVGASLGYLNRCYLHLGQVEKAVAIARKCVEFTSQATSDQGLWKLAFSALGSTLHYAGEFTEAEVMFRRSDAITERSPTMEAIYILQELQFVDLLFDLEHFAEIAERKQQWQQLYPKIPVVNQMLGVMLLCRAEVLDATRHPQLEESLRQATEAMLCGNSRGIIDYDVRITLMLAAANRLLGHHEVAKELLQRAVEVTHRVGLRLLEVDCALEVAEQALRRGEVATARAEVEHACERIEAMGYRLRQRDVEALMARLEG